MYPVQSTAAPAVVQQGHTVITHPGYPAGPVVVRAIVQPQSRMNVKAIRGLGITQIVLGILTIGLGIGCTSGFNGNFWLTNSGAGIWGGAWIVMAGVLGVLSSGKPESSCLNGTNMAFTIVATVVSFIDGIFFVIGIGFYNDCEYQSEYRYNDTYSYYYRVYYDEYGCFKHATAGRAVYSILLILTVAEFFVALVAAMYCCQATCCCGSTTPGVILQPPAQQIAVSNATNYGFMHQSTYPTHNMAVHGYGYPQQQFQQTPITAAPAAMTTDTNTSYSNQYQGDIVKLPPPPAYDQ